MEESESINQFYLAISVLFKGKNFIRLLNGLWVTVWITLVSVLLSIFFGLIFGFLMNKKNKVLRLICKIHLEIMRITPQLVLLFIAYYGISHLFGISISGELASILVFTLWGSAEMGDLVRAGLEAIPNHQYESGRALGLKEKQIFFYIILPQTIRGLIPTTMNLITRMIKTTSLVVFVGVIEVVKIGQQIIEANRIKIPSASIAVYGLIFILYFLVCWPISLTAKKIEKRGL
ncbi:MAG: amino acid ABC transporter permease [Treponema sp.]|nr:amino acid ABC transporter permease [Treponema sp.]